MNGVIRKINSEKGFGFVKDNVTQVDHFFYRSSVKTAGGFENLREGQAVSFDDVDSPKGPRAENLR